MPMIVELREITRDNWLECARLAVTDDQKHFVAPNVYSLAESKFCPEMIPLAIYDGETMVGFTMWGHATDADEWWIIRLMTDIKYQGRGYGRAAMTEVIWRIRERSPGTAILVSYEPANAVAEKLYMSLGFEKTGRVEDGELVVRLPAE